MRYLAIIFIILICLAPLISWAQQAIKTPGSYSLREYTMVLAIAVLGGLVAFYNKVRKGELQGYKIHNLIGELCTSAFAGLLTFWICEWGNLPQLLTIALVGVSGHAGTVAIAWLERTLQRFAESKVGLAAQPDTKDKP